jgi:tRNA (guanine37-N1)-methyltransferase
MLCVSVISVHPAFVDAYARFGVLRAALAAGSLSFESIDLRDFAIDKHASVDDAPYGGGDGMVLRADVLLKALDAQVPEGGEVASSLHVITTAPGAKPWTQQDARRLAAADKKLVFICGRFAGVDQRFIDHYVNEEFSIGDFVVSGGELPVMAMVDSIVRLCPGALGNSTSARDDSFSEGMDGLLEYPLYTRPQVFEGVAVPPVLLSGDHAAIKKWRREQALARTARLRPDLLPGNSKSSR